MLEFLLSLGFTNLVEAANASPVFAPGVLMLNPSKRFSEPSFTSGTSAVAERERFLRWEFA
jgi:hypothetical protein